jgi:hypothetical protein
VSDEEIQALQESLDEFLAVIPSVGKALRAGVPGVRERVDQIVDALGMDYEILEEFGYYRIEQAYTRICDNFQHDRVVRIRSFSHCGQDHSYHALQGRLKCPICKDHRKALGLFGLDEIETVAHLALLWLKIDPRTIPGWNSDCDGWNP